MKQQRLRAAEHPEELLSSNTERDTKDTDLFQEYALVLAINVRVSGIVASTSFDVCCIAPFWMSSDPVRLDQAFESRADLPVMIDIHHAPRHGRGEGSGLLRDSWFSQ